MIRLAKLTLFICAGSATAVQAQISRSEFQITPLETALDRFEALCIGPMPDPQAFVDAMNASGLQWTKLNRSSAEMWARGDAWQSTIGQISYHYRREDRPIMMRNPACHFEFVVPPDYAHSVATLIVQSALDLGEPCSRNRQGNQTRWEKTDPRGFVIRVFLSSETDTLDRRGARLSVSRMIPQTAEVEDGMRNIERCH